MPEDVETGGLDAVCPDCAKKYAEEEPLTKLDRVRLVELPLNAQMEDVIGGLDDRAALHERMRIRRGILSHADRNILYVDEVNLLDDDIIDAILDAAAQGRITVRRGPISATYRARFTFIGSMNPEEGQLRPQIMDRFGLRVLVRGLIDSEERLEAYRRVEAYLVNPRRTVAEYASESMFLRDEIQASRKLINQVTITDEVANQGLEIIKQLQIHSLRAEITLFEAARAYTAADARQEVTLSDLQEVALLALRARRSTFLVEYLSNQEAEETEIHSILNRVVKGE
jgi:magnesium chelatase subunit I